MPQVSKYPLAEDVYERIFEVLLKTIVDLRNKKKVEIFLSEFLTPTEKIMLAKRLAIAHLLAKGYKYKEIAKVLRVSTSTVGRVSISFRESKEFKKVVEKTLKDEAMEKMWLDLADSITSILSAGKSKSGSWRYLKEEIRNKKKKKGL